MKLFYLTQDEHRGYDTYDAVIVAAESEDEARLINPAKEWTSDPYGSWCSSPEAVEVTYLGEASPKIKAGIILASFNAG